MRKYKEIVFNGKYMCKKQCRGVQRYTREVLSALDKMPEAKKIKVIIPHCTECVDKFENIRIVRFGGYFTSKLWQFIGYQLYIWIHHALAVNLSDGFPLWNMGIVAIHDIRYNDDLNKKMSIKARLGLLLTKRMADRAVRKAEKIITVSDFSKNEINKKYGIPFDKIVVCYNAWQHLSNISPDEGIFEKDNRVSKGDYYFSLGGNEESKNMFWILRMVQKYPERMFVMAGPKNLYFPSENVDLSSYSNFIHLGYVSDGELKALMKYCKAFLFPSKYEGFGIPPMEAISVGAKVIMSNAACLPEIYKDCVSYFNPDNYDVDLDYLLENCPADSGRILELYSWTDSAKKILEQAEAAAEIIL